MVKLRMIEYSKDSLTSLRAFCLTYEVFSPPLLFPAVYSWRCRVRGENNHGWLLKCEQPKAVEATGDANALAGEAVCCITCILTVSPQLLDHS